MPREYAPIDTEALKRQISSLARRYSRYFPSRLMDYDDFIQSGYLGAMSVIFQEKDTPEELISRQVTAARREMIDAMRSFGGFRSPNGRQKEMVVSDIDIYSSERIAPTIHEDVSIKHRDLLCLAGNLEERERMILRERLCGSTLLEIAEMLKMTEGRISQMQTKIVNYLRASLSK